MGRSTGGGPHARDIANSANTGDDMERRQSKATRCGIVHCTRGRTTIHMLWVWAMEPKGSSKGGENGRVLVQLDHQRGGRTVGVTQDHLSGQPPGNGSSRGS